MAQIKFNDSMIATLRTIAGAGDDGCLGRVNPGPGEVNGTSAGSLVRHGLARRFGYQFRYYAITDEGRRFLDELAT